MTDVSILVVQKGDLYLLGQRQHDDRIDPLCWEFPGGKKESDEDDVEAALREADEEVGFYVLKQDRSKVESLPGFEIGDYRFHVYRYFTNDFQMDNKHADNCRGWFTAAEASNLRLTLPTKKILLSICGEG